MGMNIKNPNVERLARELAAQTGETITTAIQGAIEEKLQRLERDRDLAERIRQVDEILARIPAPPSGLTSDHSDLYDEWGLPR